MTTYYTKYLYLFLSLFLSLASSTLFSQVPIHYRNYTVKDGLASDAVYGVMQDRDGYIWAYTEKGISKFNGYEFKNFQEGLPKYDVWLLTEDSKGRLWVHTIDDRLVYIYRDSIHEVKTPGNHQFYITNFYEANDTIWFSSRNKTEGSDYLGEFFIIDNDSVKILPFSQNTIDVNVTKEFYRRGNFLQISFFNHYKNLLLFKKDSVLYMNSLTGKIVNRTKADTKWAKEYINLPSNSYLSSYRFNKNNFFLTSNPYGAFRWDDINKTGKYISFKKVYNTPNISANYSPSHISEESIQITLMPNPGFLEMDFDLNVKDTFRLNSNDFNFRRIFKDRAGNMWIATSNNGIYFVSANSRNAESFTTKNDNRFIRLIKMEGEDQPIILSTANGGLYQFLEDELKPIHIPLEIGKNINGLAITKEGKLFIGAESNFIQMDFAFSNNKIQVKNLKDLKYKFGKNLLENHLFKDNIKNILSRAKRFIWDEKRKRLWFAKTRLVGYIDFSAQPYLINGYDIEGISAIAFGKNGNIWIGGSGGIWEIKNEKLIGKQNIHPLLQKNINDLEVDDNDILWAGTDGFGDGVFGFKDSAIYHIPASQNVLINDLFWDKNGYLWVGTNQGVQQYKIDPNNFNEQKLIQEYKLNDGILSQEVNTIYVDEKYIYVGSYNGLSRIEKKGKFGDKSPPRVLINQIRINGNPQPFPTSSELEKLDEYTFEFNYSKNDLEIDFVALSFKSLGNINYWYQLENIDDTIQFTQNRTVRYPDLRPGTYTFKLKAIDVEDVESILKQPITFIIHPPFWQRTWFYFLGLLFTGSILLLIFKTRIRIIKEREAAQTKANKQIAELELKALQSQMNPHFVFNALSSIRYYIQENKTEEAGDYLAKFAKLMRLFLESSKNKFAPLEKEIELIKLYVEMERLRFENKFQLTLKIGDDVNPLLISIPTMLIQPFVENAINHGLFHKESSGLLILDFNMQDEDTLLCIIEDDGIGREKAKKIRQESIKGYKSRGMQIVEERLEVLKHIEDVEIKIEIIDLKNLTGKNSGTKAILKIPIID
ncbi:MAG: histidine kinase [Saprospiraceae bacterium]